MGLSINSARQDRVSTLPFLCPSLVAMATRQQVETAVRKGVRGNMKCIHDLLCRRVFVRESKNCIRRRGRACVFMFVCTHTHTQELRSIVHGEFISTGTHAHKKDKD